MEDSEIIDSYINGSLKGGELLRFVDKMYSDPEIARKVKIRKAIIRVLNEDHDNKLREKLVMHDRKLEQGKLISFLSYGRIAAMVLILLSIASLIFILKDSNSHFEISKYDLPEIGLPNEMTANNYFVELANAMNEFKSESYVEAYLHFGILLAKAPTNDTLLYFTGISAFRSRNFKAGRENFEKVILFIGSIYKPIAEYRLGLCYLNSGEISKAEAIFKKIAANPYHKYSENSQKVLRNLQ
jgi:tetratricopeptide (TPR) repeat protein